MFVCLSFLPFFLSNMCDPVPIEEEVFIATVSHISSSTEHLSFLKDEEIILIERIDNETWKVCPSVSLFLCTLSAAPNTVLCVQYVYVG